MVWWREKEEEEKKEKAKKEAKKKSEKKSNLSLGEGIIDDIAEKLEGEGIPEELLESVIVIQKSAIRMAKEIDIEKLNKEFMTISTALLLKGDCEECIYEIKKAMTLIINKMPEEIILGLRQIFDIPDGHIVEKDE